MIPVPLNGFDITLLIVIFLSFVAGIWRGFFKEIISLMTWLAAFFIAILFSKNLAIYLNQYVRTEFLSSMVSFVFLFLMTLVAGGLINCIATYFTRKIGLTLADRLLGGIFGLVRGGMIALFIVFIISNTVWAQNDWFMHSQLTSTLQNTATWIQEQVVIVTQKTNEGEKK